MKLYNTISIATTSVVLLTLTIFALVDDTQAAVVDIATSCKKLDPQFVLYADSIVHMSKLARDPLDGIAFLKDIMKFDSKEIDQITQDAINYFNKRFGIDFSDVEQNSNGQRFLPTATFQPFRTSPAIGFSMMQGEKCFENRDGGFGVVFNSTQTLQGTYGAENGIPVQAGDTIVYGFFNIPLCRKSPVIIRYQSATPIRSLSHDGFRVTNSEVYNAHLGAGQAQGVFGVTPVGNGELHFTIRYVVTFPTHL